jgi:ankyrin repeat protein
MEDTLEEEKDLINDPEEIEKISEKIFSIIHQKDETLILSEFYKKEYKAINLTLCINHSNNNNTILTTLVNYNLTRATINFLSLLSQTIKSSSELLPYINQKNTKGYNALLYSAFRGNLEIFTKLMESGADLSITNSSGLNALHLASQGNFQNIIVYLVEKYGIDINSKDNKGNTALHWAVYMNSKQAVDYLIYYNIDTNLRDNDGETALGIAIDKGNQYLIKRFNEDFSVLINKRLEENRENQDNNENDNDIENSNQNSELSGNNISNRAKRNNFNEFFNKFWGTNSTNMAAFPFLLVIFTLEGMNQIIILQGYKDLFMSLV